jgi:hypothetical protein
MLRKPGDGCWWGVDAQLRAKALDVILKVWTGGAGMVAAEVEM